MRRLTTVSNSIEATFLLHALDREGINSFITNEHISTMLPHFNGMPGHGIQIMVRETDFEKPKEFWQQNRRKTEPALIVILCTLGLA